MKNIKSFLDIFIFAYSDSTNLIYYRGCVHRHLVTTFQPNYSLYAALLTIQYAKSLYAALLTIDYAKSLYAALLTIQYAMSLYATLLTI